MGWQKNSIVNVEHLTNVRLYYAYPLKAQGDPVYIHRLAKYYTRSDQVGSHS